ncbi:hypothetical protein Rhe02_91170 [Rhizocola hellebori]|uniref:Uncharacterized protein n=1 Tax=Rhizocola hellebori TaxID=1392758 RepID=A0A8J3VLP5_9ACTN|nr:hypothetical protein [Rhizocola hellebori]GIH11050.1 hypothetical protein Rhe02_91170 [Rhizocola hellebori]
MSTLRPRFAAAALALAGLLFLLYPAVRPWHDETTAAGAAASMGSSAWVAAHFFAIIGFILVPIGLLCLRTITPAIVFWIGSGLVLPYYGAEDFGLHAIATGKGDLLATVDAVRYQPVAITIFGVGLLLIAAGAILTAVAWWNEGGLARWGSLIFAIAFATYLPQFFTPAPVRIAHGVLAAVGCLAVAANLWRQARI